MGLRGKDVADQSVSALDVCDLVGAFACALQVLYVYDYEFYDLCSPLYHCALGCPQAKTGILKQVQMT